MSNDQRFNNTVKNWMVISWKHSDHLDSAYGELLANLSGTREDAEEEARRWIPRYSPVGIVEEFNG